MHSEVLIVGGGFSGVAALHVLRQRGLDARLLEAGSGLGGVWFWNRYPGARCDAEVFDYSFAFPEIEDEWTWSHRFAYGDEIRAHIAYVVERFGLDRFVELDARVSAATYDESGRDWTLVCADGRRFNAPFTVWATGSLSATQLPDLQGIGDFAGQIVHTGAWPDDGVPVAERSVGVIGTGSSGVQIIPELARDAAQLVVFQRTANHVVPAHNRPLDEAWRAELRATVTERRAAARQSPIGLSLEPPSQGAFDVDDDERRREYERRWALGGFNMLVAFDDLDKDEKAAATADAFVREKIRAIVGDPDVAARLMPGDHPFGTKRVGVGEGYHETFNRANVRLVDARSEAIERVTPGGVRLSTGEEIALDLIVCATGFDSFSGALRRVDIRGRDGRALADRWADGPSTLLGLAVPGFPNLFLVNGPGSPSVFGNAPLTGEDIATWIADLLVEARTRRIVEIDARPDAAARWTDHLEEVAGRRLLHKVKSSWYHGGNTPGKPRRFMAYAGGAPTYNALLTEARDGGYPGFEFTPAVPPGHVAGAAVFVSDLERELPIYLDVLGLDAAQPRPLDLWLAAAIGREPGDGRVVELSADGFPAGRVWLVELGDLEAAPPGRTDRMENGRTVMVFSSLAIDRMTASLSSLGARRIADPVPLVSEWGRSQEFVSFDPEGAPVCLLEMLGTDGQPKLDLASPWPGTRTDQASPMVRVSQFAADLDRSMAFYRERLGLRQLEVREFSGEVGGTLGVPPCRIRMAYMAAAESPWEPGMTAVGITEVSDPPLSTRPAPPSGVFAGQVATVLTVADPGAARAGLREAGVRFLDRGDAFFDPDDNLVVLVGSG
jgi:cation diffusion facilitator CzcD-associated flavoprotein CzcO/catechol 2,3-dioxygenase-like lactoylglutathione lyase family enzyme